MKDLKNIAIHLFLITFLLLSTIKLFYYTVSRLDEISAKSDVVDEVKYSDSERVKYEGYVAGTKREIEQIKENNLEIDELLLPKNYVGIRVDDLQVAVARRYVLRYSDSDMDSFIAGEYSIYIEENKKAEAKSEVQRRRTIPMPIFIPYK